jgi:lysozyme
VKPSWIAGSLAALCVAIATAWFAGTYLYARGHLRFNYPSETRYPVRGIDVSHHQGRVDWDKAASAPLAFAFIKASEGADHRDREFAANWQAAADAGIARGAYHFFTFCTPGAPQARHFLDVVGEVRGELPLAVDVEFAGNCKNWVDIDSIRTELRAFLGLVEAEGGHKPVLYAPRDAYEEIVAGYFDDHVLWLRDLLEEPRRGDWRFWQYADNGRVPGFETLVDLNVFRGTRDELFGLVSTTQGVAPGSDRRGYGQAIHDVEQ